MQKKKVTCKTAAVKRHEWSLVHSKTFHQNVKKNCGLFLIVTKALEKQKQFQAKVFCDSSNRLVVLFCIIGLISYKCTIRVTTPPLPLSQPPQLLPLLCCWTWMRQTGLRLNWAEEFQHLACILCLRSFGCSWWFPVDPQRLDCSGFGPCLPWTLRAWCSGAWLPQLGLSVKS